MPTIVEKSNVTSHAPDRLQEVVKTGMKPLTHKAPVAEVPANIRPDSVEAPKEATTQEDPMASRFAALARQQKGLQAQAQKLKAEREAFEAEKSKYQTGYVDKNSIKERLVTEPLKYFQEQGVSIDEITNAILNQPGPQDQLIRKLSDHIKTLEDKVNKTATSVEDQQKTAYDQAVKQIRTDVKQMVAKDTTYETVKATGSEEAVVELIKDTFDKEGVLLSIEEAAQEVENYLIEQAAKLADLPKVKLKRTPPSEEQIAEQPKVATPQKTLTHAQTALSKPLSDKERKQRAILAFQGKL